MSLFDLIAPLLYKIAISDGEFHQSERDEISNYFINTWGYSEAYVEKSFEIISQQINQDQPLKEMIEPFLKQKSLKKITLKGQKYELKNARLTLDYKEDYQLLVKIVQNKGNFASRKAINNFLRKNKNLLKINFKKQAAWKKKQDNFKVPTMRKNNA